MNVHQAFALLKPVPAFMMMTEYRFSSQQLQSLEEEKWWRYCGLQGETTGFFS